MDSFLFFYDTRISHFYTKNSNFKDNQSMFQNFYKLMSISKMLDCVKFRRQII